MIQKHIPNKLSNGTQLAMINAQIAEIKDNIEYQQKKLTNI